MLKCKRTTVAWGLFSSLLSRVVWCFTSCCCSCLLPLGGSVTNMWNNQNVDILQSMFVLLLVLMNRLEYNAPLWTLLCIHFCAFCDQSPFDLYIASTCVVGLLKDCMWRGLCCIHVGWIRRRALLKLNIITKLSDYCHVFLMRTGWGRDACWHFFAHVQSFLYLITS